MSRVYTRQAAEIIAFHFGWDFADMRDQRYQTTRFVNPAVYTLGDDYYAAPSKGKMPANYCGMEWEQIGEEYGRAIFKGIYQ